LIEINLRIGRQSYRIATYEYEQRARAGAAMEIGA